MLWLINKLSVTVETPTQLIFPHVCKLNNKVVSLSAKLEKFDCNNGVFGGPGPGGSSWSCIQTSPGFTFKTLLFAIWAFGFTTSSLQTGPTCGFAWRAAFPSGLFKTSRRETRIWFLWTSVDRGDGLVLIRTLRIICQWKFTNTTAEGFLVSQEEEVYLRAQL